ncbi:MAG TPA: CAP domain-containing protein [Gaiellaceae bacterium]|nr:CAP domain-containing protein [Gaiellaceae bacterium]
MVRGGRTLTVLATTGALLFVLAPGASPADLTQLEQVGAQEQSLVNAINRTRAARGLPALQVGSRLQAAARAHSRAMARSGSFTHGNWYYRLRRFGVRGRLVGENIAWGVGSEGTAAAIVGMWMASPPHRSTMLSRGFSRVGVGVATGTMDGFRGAVVVTADFSSG